jgi:predicted RNA-binding Zn ribbon-like protein
MPTRNTCVADLELLGGHPSLDLANTMSPRTGHRPRDHLVRFADLVAWAARVGVVEPGEAEILREQAARSPVAAAETLAAAKDLREAIYGTFAAIADGRDAPEDAFSRLRHHVRRAQGRRDIVPLPSGGAAWRWDADATDLDRILWPLALGAADLLTDPERLGRIRECRGENCGWLFLDATKNRSRRWCSPRDCGNLDKVYRYRRRLRGA